MTQGFTLSYSPFTLPKSMPPPMTLPVSSATILSDSTNAQIAQIAPIFNLPSDILYHILWNLSGGWVTLDPTTDIWVFSRVSRIHRLVTLSFTNLWARISLEADDIRKYKRNAVDILRTILDRSSTDNSEGGQEGSHLRLRVYADMLLIHANLLDILTAHYTRWYSLDLHISLFLLNTLSAQMAPLGFPLLSHLRLSLGSDQTKIPELDVFSLCPSLKSVEFDSIPRCKALRLPWAGLTRIVLKERVRSDFLRMLLSAPALRHAELISVLPSLHPEDPNDDPLPKSRIIEHKSLKSLVLKCIPFAVVLDMLYLPNLTQLTLESTAQASFGSLLGFIQRSNTNLKLEKLTLSGSLFLTEPEGALARSMSSSSLPSSLPPSPLSETGPAQSPFAPNSNNSHTSTFPNSPWPVPLTATLEDVLKAAPSLTTLVLEDWTPVQFPSPYDHFFVALSRSGDGDGGMHLLKTGVSFPGTPVIGGMTSTMAAMTPGFGMTPAPSLNSTSTSSLHGNDYPSTSTPGPINALSFSSLPPASAVPFHLQRTGSQSHINSPLAGLPPHLASNPHIAAASAHLAAAGIHLPPGVLTPSVSSSASLENVDETSLNAQTQTPHIATHTQTQSPGPFSPGFGAGSTVSNSGFASALAHEENSNGGLTPAAKVAAHGALGIPIDSDDVLLPNLETLIISNLSKNVIDLHLLAGMVESRWRGRVSDLARESRSSSTTSTPSNAVTPSASPSASPPPASSFSPSIVSSLALHTDLRLIKNKGSVGRIKALQKETEEAALEGWGKKVKVYVGAKRWGGI
ncbi:hypothetical protein EV361DRAFT_918432 [Lentinula raphanica]|uniref:F-box domain-containing protein n=1 Tax=Lentinula raphanica TaxID=153919 RepID=A0AA38PHQ1_9AGAR|nr:hypothetical protein F5880DRAFT_1539532 [Lentinula raphanica]KAJ3842845.1 hypothetical protein F5878DRAFT_657240 [Lentinula raphanica]KAJ3969940.1 hypothetical protein EV361DRAFT_918432 [Lentinula raphanica]